MNKPKVSGIKRIFNAFSYSINGLKLAYKNEAAFRQDLLLAIILIPLALWISDNGVELALLIMGVSFILMAELVNSAIEAIVDRIGYEKHSLSGQAKDIGSAVVFIALITCTVIWISVIFLK